MRIPPGLKSNLFLKVSGDTATGTMLEMQFRIERISRYRISRFFENPQKLYDLGPDGR